MSTKLVTDKTSRVVSENVLRLREQAGKTPTELAALIGIGRMFLWEIETRRKSPSLATLGQIANGLSKALNTTVTASDLLAENGNGKSRRNGNGGKR